LMSKEIIHHKHYKVISFGFIFHFQ
jgi:hypothetical protein